MFHRYLQQLNAEHRIDAAREPDPSERCPCPPFRRSIEDTADFTSSRPAADGTTASDKGPKIGDVSPVEPSPNHRPVTEIVFQQRTPITGRLIDILA